VSASDPHDTRHGLDPDVVENLERLKLDYDTGATSENH
jgi:hypothetical protein